MSFLRSLLGGSQDTRPDSSRQPPQQRPDLAQNAAKGPGTTNLHRDQIGSEPVSQPPGVNAQPNPPPNNRPPPPPPPPPTQSAGSKPASSDFGLSSAFSRFSSALSSALSGSSAAGEGVASGPSSTRAGEQARTPNATPTPGTGAPGRPPVVVKMPPEIIRQTSWYRDNLFESMRLLFNWSGYVESEANRMCELYGFWKHQKNPENIQLDRLNQFLDQTIPKEYYQRDKRLPEGERAETRPASGAEAVSASPDAQGDKAQENTLPSEEDTTGNPEATQASPSTQTTSETSKQAGSRSRSRSGSLSLSSKTPLSPNQHGLPQQAALALYDAHRMKCHLGSEAAQAAALTGLQNANQLTREIGLRLNGVIEAANAKLAARREQRKKAEADVAAAAASINETYNKRKTDLLAFHERNMNSLKELENAPLPLPALQLSVSIVPDPTTTTPAASASSAQPQPQRQSTQAATQPTTANKGPSAPATPEAAPGSTSKEDDSTFPAPEATGESQ